MSRLIKKYKWYGINQQGEKCQGIITSTTRQKLTQQLQSHNITLLTCYFWYTLSPSVSNKFTVTFTQQLHTLLSQGFAMLDALQVLNKTRLKPAEQAILTSLTNDLNQGKALAQSLEKHPCFSRQYIDIITCGEQVSQLQRALTHLTQLMKSRQAIKQQVKKALFYPCCILIIALVITTGLLLFVIPQFNSTFDSFGQSLPWLTQCIVTLSQHIQRSGGHYAILTAIIVCAIRTLTIKNTAVKMAMDKMLWRIPIIKSFYHAFFIQQFTQVLSFCLASGIALASAIEQFHRTTSSLYLKQIMSNMISQIVAGKSFYQALHNQSIFTEHLKQMIFVAEQTHTLETTLVQLAEQTAQDIEQQTQHITQLLEPLSMILISGLIGVIVIAMYLPMFQLGGLQ